MSCVDVLPSRTEVHRVLDESRRIVLGLRNGSVVVCAVQGPEVILKLGEKDVYVKDIVCVRKLDLVAI